jgi:tetratricopeptide (TPR) repeat protein
MRARAGLVALLVLSTSILATLPGCAHKPPPAPAEPSPWPDLDRARDLVNAGCYDCLTQALGIFEAVVARAPTNIVASDGVALTALLLTIRERELGMLDHGYLDRARRMADRTSDPALAATLTTIADSIPWLPTGRAREDAGATIEKARAAVSNRAVWREAVAGASSPMNPPVIYVGAAYECAYGERGAPPPPPVTTDPPEPLLQFAHAICRATSAEPLIALLAREPRLVEAEYFIGLRELGARRLDAADARLTRALEKYPEWPALTLTLAGVSMTAEDTERALALYDRTLAMVPAQQEARLGRVTALSYLGRFDEAIATADGLVQEGRWYVGDALYWRAWNKTQLNRLDEAWADVTRARTLVVDDKTPKLAGLIAVKRTQYETAQALFEEARSRNPSDCDTAYYLAAVHAQLRHWPPSADLFRTAAACYQGTAEGLRREIDQLSTNAQMAVERRDRLIAKRTTQLADAIREGETSGFNAAVGFINAGNKSEAKRFADLAAQTAQYRDRAGELLARIEKMK